MVIRGTQAADVIPGSDGRDEILGLGGDDQLTGLDGNDILRGGAGDDLLVGGPGGDDLRGGPGSDSLQGESGDDSLRGGAGDDVLGGGREFVETTAPRELAGSEPGDDLILGGAGNDILGGGAGDDRLDGGSGNDRLGDDDGRGTLQGGTGDDLIQLVGLASPASGTALGGDGDDRIDGFALLGRLTLDGGADNDQLRGAAPTLTMRGRDGDDRLTVGFSDDGSDSETSVARVSGGGGSDTLLGGWNVNRLSGGGGDDLIASQGRDDRITTGPGQDLLGTGERVLTVPSTVVVTDFTRGEDRVAVTGRSFADFDQNGDGVLDQTLVGLTGDSVIIGDLTVDGVTRTSTTLIIAQIEIGPGQVRQSTLALFGVTGLTADDFVQVLGPG